MSHYSSLNGERVVSGSLYVPSYGAWIADIALALSVIVNSPITLTVGNLELRGAIIRTGAYAGSRAYRLVGGAGGWRKNLAARSYARDSGIEASMVLGDLATETGETVVNAPATSLGASYVRLAGPASRTLSALASAWYIDALGQTRIGARPASTVRSEFVPTNRNGAAGTLEIATEDPAAWLPGARFSNNLLNGVTLAVSAARFSWHLDGRARVDVVAT